MSNSGSGDESVWEMGERKGRFQQGEELATKVLSIQSKRFYLDVKHNDRGRFVKLAEVAGGGRKSRIFMTMRASKMFVDQLDKFIDFKESTNNSNNNSNRDNKNLLSSDHFVEGDTRRRYFLDLRENERGRFLRVTQSCITSGTRSSIAIPADGLSQLKKALDELIKEYGEGFLEAPPEIELPQSQYLHVDGKYIYFDPGRNERGDFVKISEVKPAFGVRNSITVSSRALPKFLDVLHNLMEKIAELRTGDTDDKPSSSEDANKAN